MKLARWATGLVAVTADPEWVAVVIVLAVAVVAGAEKAVGVAAAEVDETAIGIVTERNLKCRFLQGTISSDIL